VCRNVKYVGCFVYNAETESRACCPVGTAFINEQHTYESDGRSGESFIVYVSRVSCSYLLPWRVSLSYWRIRKCSTLSAVTDVV